MSPRSEQPGTLALENIGGIEETSVDLSPGVTVLVGRNATNRTSFLRGLMTALGSRETPLKADAESGLAELTLGDETYTRRLTRSGDSVVADGEPYLSDPGVADLFAFLLESNPARRAVVTEQGLRDLVTQPLDTERIEAEIDDLLATREALERERDRIDELKGKLPGLEERRTDLQHRIEETEAELADTEQQLAAADRDVQAGSAEQGELEAKLDELRACRSELDDVRYDLDTERETRTALRREREELTAERETLPDASDSRLDEIDAELGRLRERKRRVESELADLKSVIGFNEEMLADAGTAAAPLEAVEGLGTSEGAVTEQLLDGETVVCWTCGSDVDRDRIATTVDRLREHSQQRMGDLSDLESEIETLDQRRTELEQAREQRARIDRRLREIDQELADSDATIERLQTRRQELTEEIETIETSVQRLEDEAYSTVLELHQEANELEYELGRLETDLEQVESEIAAIEAQLDERDTVSARIERVTAELVDRRTRVERIEKRAVEAFNEHMAAILDALDYANLERIWLERTTREGRNDRPRGSEADFELHVVRQTASGTVYEDTVDHLSESEREVIGLVFALAGYLAHEVSEQLPFVLLDSLEAIDSERIETLVAYFREHCAYLVVALLPEDAAALPERYDRVTDI